MHFNFSLHKISECEMPSLVFPVWLMTSTFWSPLFKNIYDGTASDSSSQVHKASYKYVYYLVDWIYPMYVVFVKSLSCRNETKEKKFKKAHEWSRNDVEWELWDLKRHWWILKRTKLFWTRKLEEIMYACIKLHNMIMKYYGLGIWEYEENNTPTHNQ